jgi:hypothetical protein
MYCKRMADQSRSKEFYLIGLDLDMGKFNIWGMHHINAWYTMHLRKRY